MERLGNNATATFKTFFHVFLSGSAVPLMMDRFVLIDELVTSEHPAARPLAVTALGATLELHESRFGGEIDDLSQKALPRGVAPKTNAEVWEPRGRTLAHLENIGTGIDETAVAARRERIWYVRALLQMYSAKQMMRLGFLSAAHRERTKRTVRFWRRAIGFQNWTGCQMIFQSRIQKVRERAFGTDYFSTLRRWVGKRIHGDFDMNSHRAKEQLTFAFGN